MTEQPYNITAKDVPPIFIIARAARRCSACRSLRLHLLAIQTAPRGPRNSSGPHCGAGSVGVITSALA
jgi:hypothetical protein